MHDVTRRSHRIQKHKFAVTYRDTLFMKSIPVPPEHEKERVDVLRPGCTEKHYMTRRSHRMKKHKFTVTCPNTLFIESIPVPPEHEK
jgi:hypothetical protein